MTDNECVMADHMEMKRILTTQLEYATKAMNDTADLLVNKLVADWEAAGGCQRCNGTGRILTWATLDGGSYDEHGPCPECTEKSKTVGMKPTVFDAQRSCYRYTYSNLEVAQKLFTQEMNAVCGQYADAKSNHDKYIAKGLEKGDYVIVVKGRKVPIGHHGVVVGISHGQWGAKVGIIDRNGKMEWTAITNVERALGMDVATKKPAMEEWVKSNNEYAAKKGYKPKHYDVEALCMT